MMPPWPQIMLVLRPEQLLVGLLRFHRRRYWGGRGGGGGLWGGGVLVEEGVVEGLGRWVAVVGVLGYGWVDWWVCLVWIACHMSM